MRAGHIIKGAIAQVLQAAGDSGCGMILHGRNVDDFGEAVGHDARHIRTVLPLSEERSLAIDVRIVAGIDQSILDTHHADTGRQQRLIAADVNFVFVAVVNNNVAGGYAGRLNSVDYLPHDFGDEQQAGAPEGLILIPTMSEGSTNLAQAAATERSPVNSLIPRSIMARTTGCETRLRTMDFESVTSTTRPGNSPGMPSGDLAGFGPCTTLIGGGSGRVTSPKALGSMPSRNRLALPTQLALTNVRRSIKLAPSW